jgi:hypothetical protein
VNAGQREHLFELHRASTQLWGLASVQPKHWEAAYAADKEFREYLYSLNIDPHYTGNTEQS